MEQGIIPKRLEKFSIPVCASCLYASMNRRLWRKCSKNYIYETKDSSSLEDVISVDQTKPPMPVLISEITGFLTTKRYQYTTVYVDQASMLSYVYPQKTASSVDTLEKRRRDKGMLET